MGNEIVVQTRVDTKGIKDGLMSIEDLVASTEAKIGRKLTEEEKKQVEELYNRYKVTYDKMNKFLDESFKNASKIGDGLKNITRKVAQWSLAIFGVRGAYMAIRNTINALTQDDAQLKADLDYMKSALAYVLEPVVRKIVEWAKQLVFYIGYLIKAWTGHDIFASADKHLKKSVGSAKELNKQLAGFDEMNVLSDSSGGGGGAMPSFNFNDMKVPKWLQWMGKNGKKLLKIVAGIYLAFKNIKLLGLGVALYGIYTTIKGIIDFIKDPTFNNFTKILEGIALTVVGIGTTVGSLPAIIGGAIALIIIALIKNIDKIKEMFNRLNDWLDKNVLGWLKDHFGVIGEVIYEVFKTAVLYIENLFIDLLSGIKRIVDGIVKIFNGDLWGGIKDIFVGLFDVLIAPFKQWYNTIMEWIGEIKKSAARAAADAYSAGGGGYASGGGGGGSGGGGGGGGRAKGGIYYPKLAVGGIINQPGRGIPYHGATIAERGAEAVLPLTDSQQMELLGEAIGKYININATVPVYVGNRMVARELKRINAEDDFAYNR